MRSRENHYKGEYSLENKSLADFYRTKRDVFLSLLEQIPEEFKLHFLEKQYNEKLNDLKEKFPATHEDYMKGVLFEVEPNIPERSDLLDASYLEFLAELYENQLIVDKYRFVNVKWLGGYEDFIELFKVLKSHSVIESNFPQFKMCFSGATTVTFSISSMDMSVLLFELERNNKISELTINSLLTNGCVNISNSRGRVVQTLTYKEYTNCRSKYNNPNEIRKPSVAIRKLIERFGI